MTLDPAWAAQQQRNQQLLDTSRYLKGDVESKVVPLHIDIGRQANLTRDQILGLQALEIDAARTAISSLASLATIGELDHLGGGLDLTPALTLTVACTDYEKKEYAIENGHCSIGYFGVLSAFGFIDKQDVIDKFRRDLDIAGHVSWIPGGTQLGSGRLGVMIPTAMGQAVGLRAKHGEGAWVVCHCGDAGWISGQALNGFNGADLQKAPITYIMHRNGIQLSGSNKEIMDKDPRPIIQAMGIEIIEIPSLHDVVGLYAAYRQAYTLAQKGRPSLIYPTGYRTDDQQVVDLKHFAEQYGIVKETEAFAKANNVATSTKIWVPGALMSYRDLYPMLECVFLVNNLPGGKGHHDGSMKGRKEEEVLANPMMQATSEQQAALSALRQAKPRLVKTLARPASGSPNLVLSKDVCEEADKKLPPIGKETSPRGGSQAAYEAVAKSFPERVFVISCDLDASTKLDKARQHIKPDHQFEMSIEEQVSAMMANGLAMSSRDPQLNVFSTFAAFFEGIAREGFEMWRYQRNLNGVNEGLNVCMHLSHVGACTGRDHFSGWGLDWISLALGYLPYLHRFYAPADVRSAFVAVKDLAAHYGAHIIGIPRDNLPVLAKQDGSGPLYKATDDWEPITSFRRYEGATKLILAMGAPAFLADQAAARLAEAGTPVDVAIVNGMPLDLPATLKLIKKYPGGVVSIEDGLIGGLSSGLRGFAAVVAGLACKAAVPADFIGIVDPRTAPSEGHMETWEHFGITADALVDAVKGL